MTSKLLDCTDHETAFDPETARREGWGVFDCSSREGGMRSIEIRRASASTRFASDEDARCYVVTQARHGSCLHRAALALLDPLEKKFVRLFCGEWE